MASSDDEGEAVPHLVSNYHFVDDNNMPISFSELPVQWNEGESRDGEKKQIFLHGNTDNGLQKIYEQVTAWKFDLSDTELHISVLSKENNWIKLQKPRKSFEDTTRTILITLHFLHLVKKNPETSGRVLWDHLSKVLSSYEARPSESDLLDHVILISEAANRDQALAKSEVLVKFMEEKPIKRKAYDEVVGTTAGSGCIVDDDMFDEIEEEGSDEKGDGFDSVCAICDNGGEILCCEGRCLRSFHATEEAGTDSMCKSLGLSDDQVEAIQSFWCKNCQYKQHQCCSCGELGSSDKSSSAEVFQCVAATCGRFYHPNCAAKQSLSESEAEAEGLQKKIAAGEPFMCPAHKCSVCKRGEDKNDPDLQFAVCRRCPKSYHRKCLPREIAFEDSEDEDIIPRAWEDLIPDRILIYCLEHEIDEEIKTPIRNHIRFPNVTPIRNHIRSSNVGQKKKNQTSGLLSDRKNVALKERGLASEDSSGKRTVVKPQKGTGKFSSAISQGDSSRKSEGILSGPAFTKKRKVMDTTRKLLNKTSSTNVNKSTTNKNKTSLGQRLYAFYSQGSEGAGTVKPVAKELRSSQLLDADSKKRILALMKDAASSITVEMITEKQEVPLTHSYSSRNAVDKNITLGKVEGSIEALHAALQKLEEGCSIEDAKAVCEPGLLNQIVKWKNKLKVYLAPFLYGPRYTSFGRHFTKVEKLEAIVDRLHFYVQDGDMIVDFCCGANDFSCLMKKRLDEMGKKCAYKNYDLKQAANDFNFERRDWMSVFPKELPDGSQLIMGLNPPFGVNAALANKFINKALEFKPKLLILIVPRATERLDKKGYPYDLVWEDDELLAGKSFYLPGSVDVNDKQIEQWNVSPPPLYLWSRPDWIVEHKAIAQRHGHLSRVQAESHLAENLHEMHQSDVPVEDHQRGGEISMLVDDHPFEDEEPEQVQKRATNVTDNHKEDFARKNGGIEGHGKNQSSENPKTRNCDQGKQKRGSGEKSPEEKENGQSSLPCHSQPKVVGDRSLDGHSSKPLEMLSYTDVGNNSFQHFEHSFPASCSQFGTGYGRVGYNDIARRYSSNNEEPYSSFPYRWSNDAHGAGYGVGNSEQLFSGYQRENVDSRDYRSYFSEMDEKYRRESDILAQVQLYGRQDPDSMSYLAGNDHGLSSAHGHPGVAADSSYSRMSTSTMQQYAPRLDELNHARMNSLGFEHPPVRSGIYDSLPPRHGIPPDSLGFAPEPYHPFSQNHSPGWRNE